MTRRIAAALLAVAVWNFCSIAAVAREVGSPAPLGDLLGAARASVHPTPRAVSGEVGQVSWTRLPRSTPAWNCRTGEGSGVTIDLASAGKISLSERSNVNVRAADDAVVLTLLEGALTLEGAAGARVETFDGVYSVDASAGRVRFAWRDGSLAASGSGIRKETGEAARVSEPAVSVEAVETPAPGRGGRSQVAVRVTDLSGRPVAGAPVVFSPAPSSAAVALSGAASQRVLTGSDGIAAVTAAVRAGAASVLATVPGIPASAVVAAEGKTSGGQKVFAVILLGALAVVTAVLVAKAVDDDDPKLTAGTPTLVR